MKKIYLLATIMALITGLVVYIFINNLQKTVEASGEIPTTPVVVAVKSISENTVIDTEMLEVRELPTISVTPGTARTPEELVGKIAKFPISPGEQIVIQKLKIPGSTEGTDLSYRLKDNERAMTISVNETTGVAGFIRAGDFIDIMTTDIVDSELQTFYMLKNIRVIMVSNKGANLAGGEILSYGTVTLCLSAEECLLLGNAINMGNSITLTLRPITEDNSKTN